MRRFDVGYEFWVSSFSDLYPLFGACDRTDNGCLFACVNVCLRGPNEKRQTQNYLLISFFSYTICIINSFNVNECPCVGKQYANTEMISYNLFIVDWINVGREFWSDRSYNEATFWCHCKFVFNQRLDCWKVYSCIEFIRMSLFISNFLAVRPTEGLYSYIESTLS